MALASDVSVVTRLDRSYQLTVRHLPDSLRPRLQATIASIDHDHPVLPGPDSDVTVLVPSTVIWHRRRISGSAWWVHYTFNADTIVIRSVTLTP